MRPRLVLAAALALAVACSAAVAPATASDPSSGTVSSASPQVSWSGGPLLFTSFGVECQAPGDPTCDRFDLTIGSLAAEAPDVVVSAAAANSTDVLALYVYAPDGTLVAQDGASSANPRVELRDPAPGTYTVWVEAFLGTAPVTYQAVAAATDAGPSDPEVPCNGDDEGLGPPPQEVLAAALADDGRVVRLDVLVLLDGVDEAFARAFFARVAVPYEELDIHVAPVFRTVPDGAITSDVTTEIIEQTKALVPGGRVPAEFDVVELLTHRDIEALGQKAVAGQAECIGGAAFKEHGFNVSEAQADSDPGGLLIGPVRLVPDQAAKITAHEIGHLFGGQHHFANCVEGVHDDAVTGGDSSPCTLMFNAADFISLHFGTVNGSIVRGYALTYAAANDGLPAPGGSSSPAAGTSGAGGESARGGAASAPGGRLPATGGGRGDAAGAVGLALLAVLLGGRRVRRWREFRPSR